jgi:hypothetical protein
MTWFVITGRIAGDNADTVSILQAPSKDYAIAAFEAELMEEDPDNDGEILVSAVIQCDTEPKRV